MYLFFVACQYIHMLKTQHNDSLIEINKSKAINEELKCQVYYLEKSLSGELGEQESYNYFIENILQKFVTTNEELNDQLKASF